MQIAAGLDAFIQRRDRPPHVPEWQRPQVARAGARRGDGVARAGDRVVRAEVRDAGFHADHRQSLGFEALVAKLAEIERRGLAGRQQDSVRHVFQTIGADAKDPDAVSSIMGHADASMAGVYRERIADERLGAVVNVLRTWLWPEWDPAPFLVTIGRS